MLFSGSHPPPKPSLSANETTLNLCITSKSIPSLSTAADPILTVSSQRVVRSPAKTSSPHHVASPGDMTDSADLLPLKSQQLMSPVKMFQQRVLSPKKALHQKYTNDIKAKSSSVNLWVSSLQKQQERKRLESRWSSERLQDTASTIADTSIVSDVAASTAVGDVITSLPMLTSTPCSLLKPSTITGQYRSYIIYSQM